MNSAEQRIELRERITFDNISILKNACTQVRNASLASVMANTMIFLSTALTCGVPFGVATVVITIVPVNSCIIKTMTHINKSQRYNLET